MKLGSFLEGPKFRIEQNYVKLEHNSIEVEQNLSVVWM